MEMKLVTDCGDAPVCVVCSFRIDEGLDIRRTYGLESMEDGRGSLEGMAVEW